MAMDIKRSTWTILAAFTVHRELLLFRTSELRTRHIGIHSLAMHAAVLAFALYTLRKRRHHAVVVKLAVHVTVLCEHHYRTDQCPSHVHMRRTQFE